MVKNLFIFTCTVFIMLLGLQPAIAEKKYCVFIPPEDNAAADTNSTQYRKGIMDYYNSMEKNGNGDEVEIITNEDNNCLLYIEPYNTVKPRHEKIPIISVSHDRTKGEESSEDDPYQFFLIPDGNKFTDAAISYMGERLGGKESLKGKTIMTLISPDYGDDKYLNELSEKDNFTHDSITIYASDEQKGFIWSYISKHDPAFVLLRGKGINISSAIKNADEFYYPVSKLIGDTWDGHNEDLIDLTEKADGYQTLSVINSITNNTYWELLGRLAAIVSLEAIDFAKEEFGDKLNRGQVRWALENLDLSQNDLRKIGIEDLVSPIKMDCNNRNILREIYIQEWDADDKRWKVIDDFPEENDGEEGEEEKCREKDLNTILKISTDKKLKALDNLINTKTLDYANLSNIDLTGRDLTGANLYGADLTGADLTGANLTRADLTRADLIGVDLTKVILSNTTLTKTNLTDANLAGINLSDKDLTGTNLTGADLTGADLIGADLTEADLTEADLTEAVLHRAALHRAALYGAALYGAALTGAALTGAALTGAALTGADLTGADLTGADLTGADLTGADLTGANLYGADLTGADISNTIFTR